MVVVSVIIPTYNRPEQTRAAVASVDAQDYDACEIIVVDDGSTPPLDTSFFEGMAKPWRLLRLEKNRGVAAARNAGIAQAVGEWIAFLDSDDIWLPSKITMQMQWLQAHPDYRIAQTQEQWVRKGVMVHQPKQWHKKGGDIFFESLERCMVSPSSVIIHSSLFNEVGVFNEAFPACEDYDLWLRITKENPVGLIDQILMVRYGGADDQLSTTIPVQDRYRISALYSLLQQQLSTAQREAVLSVLEKKVNIVVTGLRKRGNDQEADALQRRFLGVAKKKTCRIL